MPAVRRLQFLLVPATLAAVLALVRFAAISLRQAFHMGLGEGLMMAWVLLFVAALPLLLVARFLAAAMGRGQGRWRIVPPLGVKIP